MTTTCQCAARRSTTTGTAITSKAKSFRSTMRRSTGGKCEGAAVARLLGRRRPLPKRERFVIDVGAGAANETSDEADDAGRAAGPSQMEHIVKRRPQGLSGEQPGAQ